MAEKTQDAKEISVEQKLKALYDLQTIVSDIDKIKIYKTLLILTVKQVNI